MGVVVCRDLTPMENMDVLFPNPPVIDGIFSLLLC